MRFLPAWLLLLATCVLHAQTPHPRAHSHNDYLRKLPLADALAQGFGSVEADIHLVDGQLLVAHERSHTVPGKTLESLYLAPLRARCEAHQGQVHPGGKNDFHLLIDIKADAEAVYAVLNPLLAKYRSLLTRFTPTNTTPGAITVVLSGARPIATVAAQPERWCGIDGRFPDLKAQVSPHLYPWISDSFRPTFHGLEKGRLSDPDRALLRQLTTQAHARGHKLRIWGAPDRVEVWRDFREGGVDFLNADDLPALAAFLEGRPAPTRPPSREE